MFKVFAYEYFKFIKWETYCDLDEFWLISLSNNCIVKITTLQDF